MNSICFSVAGNAFPNYMSQGDVTPGVAGDRHRGEVLSDMTTGFVALCAIYFPSVTGRPEADITRPI